MRKVLFWFHLITGLLAAVFIAVMCFTGALLAFEKELVAWAEREVRHVEVPAQAERLPLAELQNRLRDFKPGQGPSAIVLSADPAATVAFQYGREEVVYVNPYSGALLVPETTRMHDFMHVMVELHRWLALSGDARAIGKGIQGAANLIFFALAVTGLVLWWPKSLSWRGFKAVLLVNLRATGKARDWNWHNSLGFWAMPVLIVLTLTAVPISYRWGANLVYTLAGEAPPPPDQQRQLPSGPTLPEPVPGQRRLDLDTLFAKGAAAQPEWQTLTLRLQSQTRRPPAPGAADASGRTQPQQGSPSQAAPSSSREARAGDSPVAAETAAAKNPASPESESKPRARSSQAAAESRRETSSSAAQATALVVSSPAAWPRTATTTVWLNPFNGDTLRTDRFEEQGAARQLRSWLRYLHTGEALGWPGQLAALLACLAGCVLVYTGIALSWRRFFRRKA